MRIEETIKKRWYSTSGKEKYLDGYSRLLQKIEKLKTQITNLKGIQLQITRTLSDMPHGGTGEDRLQVYAERIIMIEDEISEIFDELLLYQDDLYTLFSQLEFKPCLTTVFIQKYIFGASVIEIMNETSYSRSSINNFLKDGISRLRIAVTEERERRIKTKECEEVRT